jgi:two-component system sensor histidine kinase DesK
MPREPTTNITSGRSSLLDPGEHVAPQQDESMGTQTWAPRVAQLTTITVLCGYGLVAIINVLREGATWLRLLGYIGLLSIIFALQIAHSSGMPLRWSWRRRALTLSLQALTTYLPLLLLGTVWGGMAGFLAGSVLLVMAGPIRWVLFAAIGVSVLVPALAARLTAPDVAYFVVSTMLTGLVIYAIGSLSALVLEINRTRAEMARMAVTHERLRVARDLHDLLGYSLSSITLKSELTYRLLPRNPGSARQQIAEILEVARQALADVRQVARGYRDMSLAAEANSARSVFSAAEVQAQIDISCGDIPQEVDTVLATVLRESTTNVLRHSKAQHCIVRVDEHAGTVRLQMTNDGVEPMQDAALTVHTGRGLGNLATRLESIGGRLTVGFRDEEWFDLVAEAPTSS